MRKLTAILVMLLMMCLSVEVFAVDGELDNTIKYIDKMVNKKSYNGNLDWPILGLSTMNKDVSSLIKKREKQVKEEVLFNPERSTDYHRTIISAVAAGKDPKDFGGHNLIDKVIKSQLPNGKFGDTISQGGEYLINAHIWGIISLYTSGEVIPHGDKALKWLEDNQKESGGYGIDSRVNSSDIDMTGMALIAFGALGENSSNPSVKKALDYLKSQLGEDGDFVGWGGSSSESLSQVIQGLIMVGEDLGDDGWKKLIPALEAYGNKNGSFNHHKEGKESIIASYQALLALGDYHRGESVFEILRKKNMKEYIFNTGR